MWYHWQWNLPAASMRGRQNQSRDDPSYHPKNSLRKGAPAEVQQVLGWTIDTRRLTVSLPADKFTMWVDDIRRVQKARRTSTELLATIEEDSITCVYFTNGATLSNTPTKIETIHHVSTPPLHKNP
jgi:hypothetical protein